MSVTAILNEGLVLLLIGVIGIFDGLRLNRASYAVNDAYGPGWYLLIISAIMILGGVYFLYQSFKNSSQESKAISFKFMFGPAALAIGSMALSCILMPIIGYYASTALFLAITMRIFGEQSWIKLVLIGALAGSAYWFLFVRLAQLPLP